MTREHLSDELAQAYVDDMLSTAEASRCSEHAATCLDCRALVESYRALGAELDALPMPHLDLEFTAEVMARVESVEHRASVERRLAFGIVGLAAALAASAFAFAGAGAWAPQLAGWTEWFGRALRTVTLGFEVAGPIAGALRLQIVLACLVVGVPILVALRRLAPRTAEASV